MARGLKFRMQLDEGLYYLCCESKGADQLCGYRAANLGLFWHMHKSRFCHGAVHMFSVLLIVLGESHIKF